MPPNAPRVPGSSECAASLPEAPECVASPASDNCPGSLRTRHLSPSTPAGRLTPDAPEPAAWPSPESPSRELSEWAEPREPPTPGTRRVRHVSPGVIYFFQPILKYTEKQCNFRNAQ